VSNCRDAVRFLVWRDGSRDAVRFLVWRDGSRDAVRFLVWRDIVLPHLVDEVVHLRTQGVGLAAQFVHFVEQFFQFRVVRRGTVCPFVFVSHGMLQSGPDRRTWRRGRESTW